MTSNCNYSIRRWSDTAKECYKRGCICNGCSIYESFFKTNKRKCLMKNAVLEMVRKFGITEDLIRKDILLDD